MASLKGLNQKSCYNQTCIKRPPTVNHVVTSIKKSFYAIVERLKLKDSLKNSTNIDFGR